MKMFGVVLVLVLGASMWGCAGMSATQQRLLSGAAIGTGAGAAIAAAAGGPVALGAAAGAAAGTVGGLVVDEMDKLRR
jgi:osmotically inducible lipoprotein OsmB